MIPRFNAAVKVCPGSGRTAPTPPATLSAGSRMRTRGSRSSQSPDSVAASNENHCSSSRPPGPHSSSLPRLTSPLTGGERGSPAGPRPARTGAASPAPCRRPRGRRCCPEPPSAGWERPWCRARRRRWWTGRCRRARKVHDPVYPVAHGNPAGRGPGRADRDRGGQGVGRRAVQRQRLHRRQRADGGGVQRPPASMAANRSRAMGRSVDEAPGGGAWFAQAPAASARLSAVALTSSGNRRFCELVGSEGKDGSMVQSGRSASSGEVSRRSPPP